MAYVQNAHSCDPLTSLKVHTSSINYVKYNQHAVIEIQMCHNRN